jgi:protein TonB
VPAPTTTLAAAAPPAAPAAPTAKPSVDTSRVYLDSDVDSPPRKVSGDNPVPSARLKSGELIRVAVSFTVTETGDVADVEIVESGGKSFDEDVMKAVRKWKYTPGAKQGAKIKVKLTRTFRFETG